MNILSTSLLALAMSTDAFAASVSKGAELNKPHIREALRIGLIFGAIEAATPIFGKVFGKAAVGLELIHVLDHPEKHHPNDISAMIAAFLRRIQSQIDHERLTDPTGKNNKLMLH